MNDSQFKKKNRPAICVLDPVLSQVPKNKYHEVLNITKQKYREAGLIYDPGCPKRHTCIGPCTGRPIGYHYHVDELQEFIKKISYLIDSNGNIYLKNCNKCEIVKTCKTPCKMVDDYMNRHENAEDLIKKSESVQVSTDYAASTWIPDEDENQPGILSDLIERYGSIQNTIDQLPWGAVNDKRQRLIRLYCFEGRDFRTSAEELGYSNGNVARNEFYRALTQISKYATVRYYIEQHRDEISDLEYELLQLRYYKFMGFKEIAEQLKIPIGTIRSRIFRFLKKAKTKYSKFVIAGKTVSSSIF